LVGLTVGGGRNGNGGGGKRAEDRDSLVAGMDERQERRGGVGVSGAVPCGGATWQRGGGGSATWTGIARTRWLRAALTAAGALRTWEDDVA
jgi:hypothetical protein